MARSENYNIVLTGTDQTAAAFASAKRNLGQLNSAIGTLKGGFGALAAITVVTQTVSAVESLIESFAKIGDSSKRLGVTTDALQALRYEVAQGGADALDADSALEKFANQVSRAGTASDYLGKVLQANGVALKDSNGQTRSAVDLLQDYARLVDAAQSPQDKLRLSIEAFGRQAGPLMVDTLHKIAEDGLQSVIDQSKLLGVVADQNVIDKADQIDKRFKTAWGAATVTVKSAVVAISDSIDDLNEKMNGLLNAASAKIFGNFSTGATLIKGGTGTALTNSAAEQFYNAFGNSFSKTAAGRSTVLPLNNDAIQKQIDSIAKHAAQMNADAASVDATAGAHERLRVQLQLNEIAQQHGISTAGEFGKKIQDIADKAGAAADALAIAKLKSDVLFESQQLTRSPIDQDVASRLRSAQVSSSSAAGQVIADQIRVNDAIKNGEDLMTGFADNVEQGFLQGKSAVDSLKSALSSLESSLLSMINKALIPQLFGSLLGSFLPGGSVLPGGLSLGLGGIGHAAGGGNFGAGDWSWVGENGPELVRFGSPASVVPSAQSTAMSTPQVKFEVNNYTAADTDTRTSVQNGPDGTVAQVSILKRAISTGKVDTEMRGRFGSRLPKAVYA